MWAYVSMYVFIYVRNISLLGNRLTRLNAFAIFLSSCKQMPICYLEADYRVQIEVLFLDSVVGTGENPGETSLKVTGVHSELQTEHLPNTLPNRQLNMFLCTSVRVGRADAQTNSLHSVNILAVSKQFDHSASQSTLPTHGSEVPVSRRILSL